VLPILIRNKAICIAATQ